jgi:hypothetical protein
MMRQNIRVVKGTFMSARQLFSYLTVALCIGSAPIHADSSNDELYYLLSTDDLSCLQDHATDYTAEGGKVNFITVADCHSGQQGNGSLLDQVLNSAPDIRIDDEISKDTVVALSGVDFICLAQLTIPAEAELVAFYPENCNVEAR